MEQSILIGTKKILGIAADYDAYDHDVITHINAAFSTLQQLGVGPETGFMIENETAVWEDFIADEPSDAQLGAIKTYIYLRVRVLFDPPSTQYLSQAADAQIEQLEVRLNLDSEHYKWIPPVDEEDEED